MMERLGNERGESISEALISTLVVALGSLLFVSGVMSAQRILTRNGERMEALYRSEQLLENGSGQSLEYSIRVSQIDSSGNEKIIVSDNDNSSQTDREIRVYTNIPTAASEAEKKLPIIKAYRERENG